MVKQPEDRGFGKNGDELLEFPKNKEYSKYKAYIKFDIQKGPAPLSAENLLRILDKYIPNQNSPTAGPDDGFRGGNVKQKRPNPQANMGPSIKLYMPSGVQISDGITTGNVNLGVISGAGINAVASGQNVGESMMNEAGNLIGSAWNAINNPSQTVTNPAATVMALRSANKAGLNQLEKVGSFATGVAINPNTRVHFQDVKLRTFNFSFKIIPTSKEESDEIEKIIKKFRTELYPTKIGFGGEGANSKVEETVAESIKNYSTGFVYPNVFQIGFFYENEETPIATKLKQCYLTDFSANYNPGSMSFHKEGKFTEIDISMSFQEIETVDKNDVKEGRA